VDRWNALDAVPSGYGPSVVTIGNFDGVHRGHRSVLVRVIEHARSLGASAVAVTFDPHPLQVLHPERAPGLLTGLQHRLDLLEGVGIDAVLVMEFTRELAAQTPEQFVRGVLVEVLGAAAVVVGRDLRFGRHNSGDLATMQDLGKQYGFDVVVLDDVGADGAQGCDEGHPRRWSSTWARELLATGDVERAAQVLGRPHRVCGEVVHGDARGRELGYPTANLSSDSTGLVPADGIYAGWLLRLDLPPSAPDRLLPAAVSVGTNPTFDGRVRRVEAYVLDRDDLDLYDEQVAVEFVRRLRPTLRFDDVSALCDQMARDVEQARSALGVLAPAGD
jgi:riboflavin kinase / FMN adenylyltransferase